VRGEQRCNPLRVSDERQDCSRVRGQFVYSHVEFSSGGVTSKFSDQQLCISIGGERP
jgi:hypothetical protein